MVNYKGVGIRTEHKFKDGVELKYCPQCDTDKCWLTLDKFNSNKSRWDGKEGLCRFHHNKHIQELRILRGGKERMLKREREISKIRRKTDIQFTLKKNMSRRIRKVLTSKGFKKKEFTLDFLGCSIFQLQHKLERQFKAYMSWKNYGFGKGKWNLEHRIPMDAFDLSNIVERMAASHYLNIQPMWQPDNLQKYNKYNPSDKADYMRKWYSNIL